MKVVQLLGSPRENGTSSQISRRLSAKLTENGAEVKTYSLNRMDFRGCQGCLACKMEHDGCVLDDELTPVLREMRTMDLLLISTPVYFGDITGQLKSGFDRFYGFVKPDYLTNPNPSRLPQGQQAVFVQVQGAAADVHQDVFQKYTAYLKHAGFSQVCTIRVCDLTDPTAVEISGDVVSQINDTVSEVLKEYQMRTSEKIEKPSEKSLNV